MIPSPVERFTTGAFGDCGKGSKRRRELTTINPGAISTDLDQMIIITKFSASHHTKEFLGRPMGLSVRWVGGITWVDQWEDSALVMEKLDHFITRQSQEKFRKWDHIQRRMLCRRHWMRKRHMTQQTGLVTTFAKDCN
jgi:hypothetical protein